MSNPPITSIQFTSNSAVVFSGDGTQKFTFPLQGTSTGVSTIVVTTPESLTKLITDAVNAAVTKSGIISVNDPTPATTSTTPVVSSPTFNFGPFTSGATTTIPIGTFATTTNVDQSQKFVGSGMRASILDGQRGVGSGHRLAWGKGILHINASNVSIDSIGFINGGGGDNLSDGEAGIYLEQQVELGTINIKRCSFDNCENGIFCPTGTLADVTIDSCVFGKITENGDPDGKSHNLYMGPRTLVITNSTFIGSKGNTIKVRGPRLDINKCYLTRDQGRWIDCPGGTVVNSTGNIYITPVGEQVQNALGFYDESDTSAAPTAGSFTSTNDTFYFSRSDGNGEVIWVNNTSTVVTFNNAKIYWIGKSGSTPPQVTIQGPGGLTGTNPFVFNESNRVDSAPSIPTDPQ